MKIIFIGLIFIAGCATPKRHLVEGVPAQHMWDMCAKACDQDGIEVFEVGDQTYECRCKVHYR